MKKEIVTINSKNNNNGIASCRERQFIYHQRKSNDWRRTKCSATPRMTIMNITVQILIFSIFLYLSSWEPILNIINRPIFIIKSSECGKLMFKIFKSGKWRKSPQKWIWIGLATWQVRAFNLHPSSSPCPLPVLLPFSALTSASHFVPRCRGTGASCPFWQNQ